jgi:hypothetical protein
MGDFERRTPVDRRRASRNGRRVTDPATPDVGNYLEQDRSGVNPTRETVGKPGTESITGSARSSTVVHHNE